MLGMTFTAAASPLLESTSREQPRLFLVLSLDSSFMKVYVMFNFMVVFQRGAGVHRSVRGCESRASLTGGAPVCLSVLSITQLSVLRWHRS